MGDDHDLYDTILFFFHFRQVNSCGGQVMEGTFTSALQRLEVHGNHLYIY